MDINQINSALVKAKISFWQYFRFHPVLLFAVVHSLIILGLFTILNVRNYSDPGTLERWFALTILNGPAVPYRDFVTEYPPLAIFFFVIPALLFKEPLSYNLALAVEMWMADLIILVFLARLVDKLEISIWKSLGAYSLFILFIGPIITVRHDMIPAMLLVLTLYAFFNQKNKTTWVLLGLGIMMKIYPIILIPLLILFYWFTNRRSELYRGMMVLSGVLLIIVLPWLIIDFTGFVGFLGYHTERGLQGECSYATALLVGQLLDLTVVKGIFNFGSWNLSSPLADNLAAISPYIMIWFTLPVYAIYGLTIWRRRLSDSLSSTINTKPVRLILHLSLLLVIILILTNKVFSPQYLIWIAPLLVLYSAKGRYLLWALFMVASILTQYVFPYHYGEYTAFEALPILVEATRNFLLLVIAIIIAWNWQKFPITENMRVK